MKTYELIDQELFAWSKSYGLLVQRSELWTKMYHFYALHRAEFLQHYHKRSNVETTFHMIKAKFVQRLRSRTLTAQINEACVRSYVITSAW